MSDVQWESVVGRVVAGVAVMLVLTVLPTCLWFCFDDALAALAGVPDLGTISFWHVWPATMFVALIVPTGRSKK